MDEVPRNDERKGSLLCNSAFGKKDQIITEKKEPSQNHSVDLSKEKVVNGNELKAQWNDSNVAVRINAKSPFSWVNPNAKQSSSIATNGKKESKADTEKNESKEKIEDQNYGNEKCDVNNDEREKGGNDEPLDEHGMKVENQNNEKDVEKAGHSSDKHFRLESIDLTVQKVWIHIGIYIYIYIIDHRTSKVLIYIDIYTYCHPNKQTNKTTYQTNERTFMHLCIDSFILPCIHSTLYSFV